MPWPLCGCSPCVCADQHDDLSERPRLLPGDQYRCKKCGQWHTVFAASETTNVRTLWFKCPQAEGVFYAGTFGLWLLINQASAPFDGGDVTVGRWVPDSRH